MNNNKHILSAIPTHIITGFLGVGKTSAILHLLNNKPHNERWAVLVNEFGEIGVDGSLLQGQHRQEQHVFIREVPGGCMCCSAGLPMQVALNQLLKQARPDRLLIEPTGLGHPKEVLQSLTSESYRDVIDLQKVVTLVDARKLSDTRYTEHKTFNQQIALADIVVGNKQDLYQGDNESTLKAYVKLRGKTNAQVCFTTHGDLSAIDFTEHRLTPHITQQAIIDVPKNHDHSTDTPPLLSDTPIPESGYSKAMNQGEGFHSIGWRFASNRQFNYKKISSFIHSINAERIKAVLITDNGIIAYNLTYDALTEKNLSHCTESRIEIITTHINDLWEEQLMACVIPPLHKE